MISTFVILSLAVTFLGAQIGVVTCSPHLDDALKTVVVCGLVSTCITFFIVLLLWWMRVLPYLPDNKTVEEDESINKLIDDFMEFKNAVYERVRHEETLKSQQEDCEENHDSASQADDEHSDVDDDKKHN
jgi:hypothetical protein